MNWLDIILTVMIVGYCAYILFRRKGKGCSGCCGSCRGCHRKKLCPFPTTKLVPFMELYIDGLNIQAEPGKSLRQLSEELGFTGQDFSTRPIAAKIAGEILNLN